LTRINLVDLEQLQFKGTICNRCGSQRSA